MADEHHGEKELAAAIRAGAAMIVHLNDQHEWSRETIAAWLEENGEKT